MSIEEFGKQINNVSPSFCIAKWKQVTVHLQTGQTHSCHHPISHKIPLDEIAVNPSALHNTKFKKQQRAMMLNGERPGECDYCWRVEDSKPGALSDRYYKSYEPWAQKYIHEAAGEPWEADVKPSYLEVSFSSVCNLKCSYCSPEVSSKWMEEIERFGPYPTSSKYGNLDWYKSAGKMPIPHNQDNPYVEAFWKWWPDISDSLEYFRITGGEPLLAKDTFKVLDWIKQHPMPGLHLSINSNMCIPDSILTTFIKDVKEICADKKVASFKIYTSCEAHGKAAEYIRSGLDYNQWLVNIQRVMDEIPEVSFVVMSTYNALSVSTYTTFLQDVLAIKQKYGGDSGRHGSFIIDVPYLRHPPHQAIFILPNSWAEKIKDQVTYMYRNLENSDWVGTFNNGFEKLEADRFKRIYEIIAHKQDIGEDAVTQHHKDFVAFVDEHDRRRGTNFAETFPEYLDLYTYWKYNDINFDHTKISE